MSEHVFQDTLPTDAAIRVGKALVTKTFTPELILDGWVVAEFGLRQFVPGGLVGSSAPSGEVEHVAAGEALLAACEGESREGLMQAAALPWLSIVKAIVSAILQVL